VNTFSLYRFLNASDCRLVAGPFRMMENEMSAMATDIAKDYDICVHTQIRCLTHGWQGMHEDMCGECYMSNIWSPSTAILGKFRQAFRPDTGGKGQPAHVLLYHSGGRPHHLSAAPEGGR
jgi:hypothetical protein